jgi:hypothetical protein
LTTRIGIGIADQSRGFTCGREAALQARAELGSHRVSLALLFSSHADLAQVLEGARSVVGDAPLIGATTGGQYSHQGYAEHGAGIMLIHSESIHFHLVNRPRAWVGGERLLTNLQGISPGGLGSAFRHRTLMLFPDDQSMSLDVVVEKALTETAMLYDILGGPGQAGRTPPHPSAVFHNGHIFEMGLSGAEVLSQLPLGLSLAHGWMPFPVTYRITEADAHRVISIDGRAAREVYEDFLRENHIAYTDTTLPDILLHYPMGNCRDGVCKVNMLRRFESNGALQMASPPRTGSVVQFFSTRPDSMIMAATRAVQQAAGTMNGVNQAAALLIDCTGNGVVLGETYPQQRAAIQENLSDLPFLGIRSHGVLVRLQNQTAGHYECSVATCILPA